MNSGSRIFKPLLLILLVLIPVLTWLKIDDLSDWWKLRNYNPPTAISELARQDTMTSKARKYFYINHPQLFSDKGLFNNLCQSSEQTIILGCYRGNENGIALFDVQDSRLDGIEQVTAAHETLHAAYERLSSKEKSAINAQLLSFYNNGLADDRIKKTIDLYKTTEPNSLVDEMHSVFGTEVPSLPTGLESYYSKYFNNRQQIVSYSKNYESIFLQNQNQLESLSKQIEGLKSELDAQKAQIEAEQNSLVSENQRMQALLQNDQTDEYNNSVPAYNSRVRSLKSLTSTYNSKISLINRLIEQYNSLAYTQQSLYKSIDSRLQSQSRH